MKNKKRIILISIPILVFLSIFVGYFLVENSEAHKTANEYIFTNDMIVASLGRVKSTKLSFLGFKLVYRSSGGVSEQRINVKCEREDATKKNLKSAFIYFRKAARFKMREAYSDLHYMYKHGEGVKQDIRRASYWKRKI